MNKKLSVLAGNPKVEFINGNLSIDPQLVAFEEAMKVVAATRERVGKIGIAFDHPGLFRNQFIDPIQQLSNRKLKHLKLSHLRSEIRESYEEMAKKHEVALEDISVISEDILRARVMNRLNGANNHYCLVERHTTSCEGACQLKDNDKDEDAVQSDYKVNCRGITAAIIDWLAKDHDEVATFWQFDPVRVKPATITQGTEMAYEIFGTTVPVTQHIFGPTGIVNKTEIRMGGNNPLQCPKS